MQSIIDQVKEHLETYVASSSISYNELINMKLSIYKQIKKSQVDIDIKLIDDILSKFLSVNYSYKDNDISLREWAHLYEEVKVPKKYQKLADHFEKLKNIPQPAQRTKEWFDYRHNRITASDTASAIDLNPYEPVESFILKKCDPDYPFLDNATVFHGKKYEAIATLIYEHIYNNRVYEFGALPSEVYPFLGASPDGICSKYALDGSFSPMLGRMLEIKCPVSRFIKTRGEIAGTICPFYYYCQVQQQLACCELDQCDFWQCKISEYDDYNAYHLDEIKDAFITTGTDGAKMKIDMKLKKGAILEFYPREFKPQFEGDEQEWKSKYIYPEQIDLTEEQYKKWILDTLNNYRDKYPDIATTHYFYRIIYWKLESAHNVTIDRDDKFFNGILPILQETWSKVLYYREHLDELDTLKKIVEERKKDIGPELNYKVHTQAIMDDKCLFLEKKVDLAKYMTITKKPFVSKIPAKSKVKVIDSDHEDFLKPEEKKEIIETKITKKIVKKKPINKVEEPKKLIVKSVDIQGCNFIDD